MQQWGIIIFRYYFTSVKGLSRTNECHSHTEFNHVVLISLVKNISCVELTGTLFYIPYDDLNRGFQELSL